MFKVSRSSTDAPKLVISNLIIVGVLKCHWMNVLGAPTALLFFFFWLLKTFSEPKTIICGFLFKWIIILASCMQVSWILLQLELQHLKHSKSIRNIDYNICWSFHFYYYLERWFQCNYKDSSTFDLQKKKQKKLTNRQTMRKILLCGFQNSLNSVVKWNYPTSRNMDKCIYTHTIHIHIHIQNLVKFKFQCY